ncbi:MAG: DUF309 domain-containing protein [Alphaproteobacteria bacterium]|nr:DUF309 domain-containing protein [Alphaproteobacteria bacterium]
MSGPVPPPHPPPPRRTSRPLPGRRHVPGSGQPPPELSGSAEFAWGCDLFDHRFYWEAHEVWETEWRATPEGAERELLRGLICAAASVIKHHQGYEDGARRLRGRAATAFAASEPVDRGIDLDELLTRLDRFAAEGRWPTLPTR